MPPKRTLGGRSAATDHLLSPCGGKLGLTTCYSADDFTGRGCVRQVLSLSVPLVKLFYLWDLFIYLTKFGVHQVPGFTVGTGSNKHNKQISLISWSLNFSRKRDKKQDKENIYLIRYNKCYKKKRKKAKKI